MTTNETEQSLSDLEKLSEEILSCSTETSGNLSNAVIHYVKQRESLLQEKKIFTENEKRKLKSILDKDEQIEILIKTYMDNVKKEIRSIGEQRQSSQKAYSVNKKYLNLPKQLRGYFVDSKK